jgi:hypothetical protein
MDGNSGKKKESHGKGNKQGGWDSERARPTRMPPPHVKKTSTTRQKKIPLFCNEGYYLFGLKCAGCAVGSLQMENNGYKTNQ